MTRQLLALTQCKPKCRHRCPACRMGLVTHLPCDPQCDITNAKNTPTPDTRPARRDQESDNT